MKRKIKTFLFSFLLVSSFDTMAQGHLCGEDMFPVLQKDKKVYGYKNIFGIWRVQPTFTLARPFTGKVAVVMVKKLWGGINCEGKLIIDPVYNEIKTFIGGKAWVRKGDKWGMVNETGKILLQPIYDEVTDIARYRDETWVRKDNKWGLFDRDSEKFLTEVKYDKFKILLDSTSLVWQEGRAGMVSHNSGKEIIKSDLEYIGRIAPYTLAFRQNNKWGLYQDNGKSLLLPEFDTIHPHFKYRLRVKKNGLYGLVNLRGKKVTPVKYEEINNFYEKAARVKQNGRYGYIIFSGREVIKPQFEDADRFKNFRAIVKKDGKYGIISTKRKFILNNEYDEVKRDYRRKYYAGRKGDKWSLIAVDGKLITEKVFEYIWYQDVEENLRVKIDGKVGFYSIPIKGFAFEMRFDSADPVADGHIIGVKNEKKGIASILGQTVVPFEYDSITYKWFSSSLHFFVSKNGKYGLIKNDKKVVVAVEYELLVRSDRGTLKVKKNGKYGLLNTRGGTIVECQYDYMSNKFEHPKTEAYPAIVCLKGKFGLINEKGTEIMPLTMKSGKYLGGNLFAFRKGKRFGMYDYRGKPKTEDIYDDIGLFSEKMISFKKGRVWGFMNVKGTENIPAKYQEVRPFMNSLACVKENGVWGVIARSGKFRLKPQFSGISVKEGQCYLQKGQESKPVAEWLK